jgi:RHS repeat-associated protein
MNSGKKNVSFDYNAFGNRIAKHVFDDDWNLEKSTYYIVDAQGNQLSMCEHTVDSNQVNFTLAERNIYGASRLGRTNLAVNMYSSTQEAPISEVLGYKNYELSNHLGNVLTVINDIKIPLSDDNETVSEYQAGIVSISDYSPFGVQLDGRTLSAEGYRYGFNGYEGDPEVKGQGNSYTTEYRQYDSRIGRWLSLDPLMDKYPDISPYASYANNPIFFIDVDGDSIGIYTIDKNGNFTHVKTVDSEYDYDMIYKAEDWANKDYSNGEGIWDRSILSNLSNPKNQEMVPCGGGPGCMGIKKSDGSYAALTPLNKTNGDANEIYKLFFWLGENVDNHEFIVYQGLVGGITETRIATFASEYGESRSPGLQTVGFELSQVIMSIHNHPEKVWRRNGNKSEVHSMGVEGDGTATGDWAVAISYYYKSGNRDPFPMYVFFQNSRNLYHVPAAGGPVLKGKINNHTQFNYRGKKRK